MSLALACDVRIAADSASFVPAFIKIGLVPDSGGTWLVRRLLGAARAFEWLTTGRRLGAEEARSWGLVYEVVAGRRARAPRARGRRALRRDADARRLADEAPARRAPRTATFEEQLELEAVTQAELTQTHDFTRGRRGVPREARRASSPARTSSGRTRSRSVDDDDRRRWRLTTRLRLAARAAAHLPRRATGRFVAIVVAIVNWFIALARGRTPLAVHAWLARYVRYPTHVDGYVYLLADPYPKFRGWPGTYPVDLRVDPPVDAVALEDRRSGSLLAIPAIVFAYVLGVVLLVVAILSWFVALAVARVPAGFQNLGAYCVRYQVQTLAYLLLLTDRYPTLASGSGFQFERSDS